MSVKPFAECGHYTAVHDAVFDVVMPYCPPNAFKVLLFVLRKTRGWKKEADVLRYAEIKTGTGIKSDATLSKELAWLLDKKLLIARDEKGDEHKKGSRKAPAYSVNRDFELKVATPGSEVTEPAATAENEVVTTSETEASNNHKYQEPKKYLPNGKSKEGEPSLPARQKKVIKKLTPEEAQEKWDALCEGDKHATHLIILAEMMAEENKTGEVAVTRVWREIGFRYLAYYEKHELSDEAWVHGFQQAISSGAPNLSYVLKAAQGYKPASGAPRHLSAVPNQGPSDQGAGASPGSTPPAGMLAISTHAELKQYAPVMALWDFASSGEPPYNVKKQLGGTEDEQWRNLQRIRSVVGRAVSQAKLGAKEAAHG